jgi:DNA-binding NtrC family response regulator
MLTTLQQVNWNRAEAARVLRVSYKTLLNKLHRAGIGGKPGDASAMDDSL